MTISMLARSRLELFLIGAFLLCGPCSRLSAQQAPKEIIVRVGALTPQVVAYVAKNGQTRVVFAPAGTDLLQLISTYCGSANARRSYVPLFLAANATNADISAGRSETTAPAQFTLPACLFSQEEPALVDTTNSGPQWQRPVIMSTVPTFGKPRGQTVDADRLSSPGSDKNGPTNDFGNVAGILPTVDQRRLLDSSVANIFARLAQSSSALAARASIPPNASDHDKVSTIATVLSSSPAIKRTSSAFEVALRTQDILATNQIQDYQRIPTGQQVNTSSFAPRSYAFTARPDLDPAAVAQGLQAVLPKGAPSVEASIVWNSHPELAIAESPGGASKCAGQIGSKPWPFDIDELTRVLAVRKKLGKVLPAGRMLVLDLGFPPEQVGVAPFDQRLFIRQRIVVPSGSQYVWPATIPPTYFLPMTKGSDHGIGVLTAALGGLQSLNSSLLINNDLLDDGGFVISMMGFRPSNQDTDFQLDDAAVAHTLLGENWNQIEISVVNMSLEFNTQSVHASFSDDIRREDHTLFVFAAGNDTKDVDTEGIEPASWGGKQSPNVLSVGSIDGDGSLSYFSNTGVSVDLAAPGCKVPVYSWDYAQQRLEESTLSGTSIASPLVAFAATLLKRDYVDVSRIKSRLLGTGYYLASLKDEVWTQRALDISAALAAPFDVIRYSDGSMHLGKIDWPQNGLSVSGKYRKRENIRQLASFDGNTSTIRAMYDLNPTKYPSVLTIDAPKLYNTELPPIAFNEIDEQSASIQFKPELKVDLRTVQSVSLCEIDKCFWMK